MSEDPGLRGERDLGRDAFGGRLGVGCFRGRDLGLQRVDGKGVREGSWGAELGDVGESRLDRPDRIHRAAGDPGVDDELALDRLNGCIDRLARQRVRECDDLLGKGVGIVGDARFEGHATDRRACVRDDPFDGVTFASDGQRLSEHGLDIRPATDIGIADRGLPDRAGQDDLALAEGAIGRMQGLRGSRLIEAGQVDRPDADAGQHAVDVLLVVRVHRPGPDDRREQQADDERDQEAQPARWAARLRNGDPDGIRGSLWSWERHPSSRGTRARQ